MKHPQPGGVFPPPWPRRASIPAGRVQRRQERRPSRHRPITAIIEQSRRVRVPERCRPIADGAFTCCARAASREQYD